MLFNSYIFVFVFLPLFLLLWHARAATRQSRLVLLTAASYVFYGYWDWRFVGLMLLSTVIDFAAGQRIAASDAPGERKRWLLVSMVGNLGILAFFKYAGFFTTTINGAFGTNLPLLDLVLPVGISFYTFQSMSYTIDIYRRETQPARDFWTFAAYVSMFPQLVAGPIVRYAEVADQFDTLTGDRPPPSRARSGVQLFVVGLAKKLLIADMVAKRFDPMLAGWEGLDFAGAWVAMLGYTVQIYFDFSGYSDMAVGLGRMLGFELPQNFDSPYKSKTISEFWRRWHMSLSFWLRDYLYISLGGNRGGRLFTLRNLALTMFLGGLWHGAAWTFVVWGLIHGALLIVHNLWKSWGKVRLPSLAALGLTFVAVVFAWVFFRADSFEMAAGLCGKMVGLEGFGLAGLMAHKVLAGLTGLALVVAFVAPNSWELRYTATRRSAIGYALLFTLCVLRLGSESPFLYFQF